MPRAGTTYNLGNKFASLPAPNKVVYSRIIAQNQEKIFVNVQVKTPGDRFRMSMEPAVLVRGWTPPVDSVRIWTVDKLKECSPAAEVNRQCGRKKTTMTTCDVKMRRSWESSAQAASSRLVPTSKDHSRSGKPRDSDGRRSKTSSPLRLLQLRNTTRFPDAVMVYGDIPFEDGK